MFDIWKRLVYNHGHTNEGDKQTAYTAQIADPLIPLLSRVRRGFFLPRATELHSIGLGAEKRPLIVDSNIHQQSRYRLLLL